MDVRAWNRDAWDREVARGSRWTVPVDAEAIAAARRGEVRIRLTPKKPIPQAWFPPLAGCRVLGLGPVGVSGTHPRRRGREVTVLDMSPAQLAQDRKVAEREGLALRLEEGDMADTSPASPTRAFRPHRPPLLEHLRARGAPGVVGVLPRAPCWRRSPSPASSTRCSGSSTIPHPSAASFKYDATASPIPTSTA